MTARCKTCRNPVLWVETEPRDGKPARRMPLDADPENDGYAKIVADGNIVFTGDTAASGARVVRYVPKGRDRHVAHFATCPEAAAHRRPR